MTTREAFEKAGWTFTPWSQCDPHIREMPNFIDGLAEGDVIEVPEGFMEKRENPLVPLAGFAILGATVWGLGLLWEKFGARPGERVPGGFKAA